MSDETVTVRGGEAVEHRDGKQHIPRNLEDSALELATGVWRRVADVPNGEKVPTRDRKRLAAQTVSNVVKQ